MQHKYGIDDATYQAVGCLDGLTKLVDDFYDAMMSEPKAAKIRGMHPADLTTSRDKLVCFLSGWMGGPRLFAQKYGAISIPMAHQHLLIDEVDRDAWMLCMEQALAAQDYPKSLCGYLMQQLYVPAERVRQVSQLHHQSQR